MHEFLKTWASFRPSSGPNILPEDERLLEPKTVVNLHSWEAVRAHFDFGRHDNRLNVSLIPQPFFGNIEKARVVILTLNPGLNPVDYYGEFCVPAYRDALIANLRREAKDKRFPNLFLNPEFSWHSGFTYWHGRLAGLIDVYKDQAKCRSRMDALSYFSRSIGILELFPYHSTSFRLSNVSRFKSVKLVKGYVHDVLVERARRKETLLVVVRKSKEWGLRPGPPPFGRFGECVDSPPKLTPLSRDR